MADVVLKNKAGSPVAYTGIESVVLLDGSGNDVEFSIPEEYVPVQEKDVNFYDYDGTLLYSYTLEEAQALTELPPGPDWHDELVFYGWNWSLEDINALTYQVDVGALYDTDDHATHLHIELLRSETVSLVASGTGFIDWGDGSAQTTLTDAPETVFTHDYANPGVYVIRVIIPYDWALVLGCSDGSKNCFNGNTRWLKKAFLGTLFRSRARVFSDCRGLQFVAMRPDSGPSRQMFENCRNLECFISNANSAPYICDGCSSLRTVSWAGSYIESCSFRRCRCLSRVRGKANVVLSEGYLFANSDSLTEARGTLYSGNTNLCHSCYSLRKFTASEQSTGLAQAAFYNCNNLEELDLPSGVTTIAAQALYGCSSLFRLRFRSETPPTVANANAFNGIPATCVVEVPAASLETYQNATNYASIAAQMVGV